MKYEFTILPSSKSYVLSMGDITFSKSIKINYTLKEATKIKIITMIIIIGHLQKY